MNLSESVYTVVHKKVYGTKAYPDAIEKLTNPGFGSGAGLGLQPDSGSSRFAQKPYGTVIHIDAIDIFNEVGE